MAFAIIKGRTLQRSKTLPVIHIPAQIVLQCQSPEARSPLEKVNRTAINDEFKKNYEGPAIAWQSKECEKEILQKEEDKHTTQLYYTTPPRVNMTPTAENEKRFQSSSSSFSRLSRRFSHKERTDASNGSQRQRSVSVDLTEGNHSSVVSWDSSNEPPSYLSRPNKMALSLTTAHYPQGRLNNTFSATPRKKGGVAPENNNSTSSSTSNNNNNNNSVISSVGSSSSGNSSISSSSSSSSSSMTVVKRGKGEKKSPHDITAVEHQEFDQVKHILKTNSFDLNRLNNEHLTALDIAVMTNNIPMAKLLLSYGAKENPLFEKGECRARTLDQLVSEAEKNMVDLIAAVLNGSSAGSNVSSLHQKETEKQLTHWEFRHKLLKRMKSGYDLARPPDAPTNASVSVASSSSLLVNFSEPLNHNGAVVTSYKVEWSKSSDFVILEGEAIVRSLDNLQYEIIGLDKNSYYFVQVSAFNMKGYGPATLATPSSVQPSSWHDVDNILPRSQWKVNTLEDLFSQVRQSRPTDAPAIKEPSGDSPVQRKRKSLKNLFSLSPKFQKSLQRGIYLSCLLYHKDKILVTPEDQLPVVEVDENYSSTSIHTDFYWLMKIACTWTDVKSLRHDMYKSTSAGSTHFRGKLLQAAALLQSALGISDLGQFYHQPLKDNNGSTVLVCIKEIKDPKFLALGSGKWVSLAKLHRRMTVIDQDSSEAHELLLNSAADMILYNDVSTVPTQRGLYLGYLKLVSSMELIKVFTPNNAPNILPHVKIRDCPNVSREEWLWLQHFRKGVDALPTASTIQKDFHRSLNKAIRQLLNLMGMADQADNHRLYDLEVVELSKDVAFLVLLPPTEDVCIVPGKDIEPFTQYTELLTLPVQVFEMNHMTTYQPDLLSLYSRLSSILECDLGLAQQAQREAFSSPELVAAKERVDLLTNLQLEAEKIWKTNRWIMDIITFSRDKTKRDGGIAVKALLSQTYGPQVLAIGDIGRLTNSSNSSLMSSDSLFSDSNLISVGKDNRKIAKFYDPTQENNNQENSMLKQTSSSKTDVIRVYAAYETGLAKGTSVRLCVTHNTTAEEVVSLVVQELNKEVIKKHLDGPVYDELHLNNFCLVVCSTENKEKLIPGDCKLMTLQSPWCKGRYYVKMKSEQVVAMETSQATTV
ncbi:ankyrin repeat and fibronectin type-III domain-containing protein 1 isoform X1 [Octopus vulgaris]|uniref:Ankyrin repeat and fibronectin type-III domain-containing protein 1 isoform X1 n=1 Tax=Octopus vulgaris TaxID=6645 RepID=A0AA36FI83_OCTVU|nr:ankyrin repeat and fibronectin type-III domain-containing protein 1 isoform X1 [Octopus vulgaris]